MAHEHHGKSSAIFLSVDEILTELDLEGGETFMDAGCGDGYVSIRAIQEYLPDGLVYAVDSYDAAISELDDYKKENGIENLVNIEADLTEGIPVEDNSVDVLFMLNVFHGFASEDRDDVIKEFVRIVKDDGRIAVMEFKPVEMSWGPPVDVRCSSDELKEVFIRHGLKMTYLNEDIGAEIPEGRSHYLIIFEKD